MTICGSFSMSGIPNGKQDAIEKGYRDNIPPPTNVTKVQNADGSWTVTADWPPCPDGTTVTHAANNIGAASG
jgi:hypothetical protein